MRMIGRDFGAAQLTSLNIAFAPDELPERCKRVAVSRLHFIHHRLANNSLTPGSIQLNVSGPGGVTLPPPPRAATSPPPVSPSEQNPDNPAASSSPSIAKPFMSGAASYNASSTNFLRVF